MRYKSLISYPKLPDKVVSAPVVVSSLDKVDCSQLKVEVPKGLFFAIEDGQGKRSRGVSRSCMGSITCSSHGDSHVV